MVTLRVDRLDRGLTIPLDNEQFTVFGVGSSIGLGIYFAWVNRDWSARTKKTRFVVVAGGALVGAWLGFNATNGPAAVLTAMVGATVGANLALIVLDIYRARSQRLSLYPLWLNPHPTAWTPEAPAVGRESLRSSWEYGDTDRVVD